MNKQEFIEMNRNGWNDLIKSGKPFSNTILPEYGPFLKRNEEDLNILDKLEGSKVLNIGCAGGESLEYILKKGASDIWGIDISEEQIKLAKERFPQYSDHFIVSPMEEEVDIPHDYFDYIISIFSVGYSSDLLSSLKNAYNYLKDDGSLVISWTHPFYYCLDIVDNKVVINKSYFNEDGEVVTKGPDKINLAQHNLMISSLVNIASEANFYVDKMYEEETVMEDYGNGYNSPFWKKEKTENCPSTIIIKFKKKKN